MIKTNVAVEVRAEVGGFVGVVRSAKTGRELFASAPKKTDILARFSAMAVIADRKWNEVSP